MSFKQDKTNVGSLPGPAAMIATRLADPLLQHYLLTSGLAAKGLSAIGIRSAAFTVKTITGSAADRLSIGGLNEQTSLVLAMMGLASARHVYWTTVSRGYYFPLGAGLGVGIYNAILSTFNTLVLVYQVSRFPLEAQSLGWKQYVGAGLFALGMACEFGSEETRRRFKAKPENKGQVDNTGLFGIVRHPNYAGYALWRTGITLATGNVTATVAMFLGQIGFFSLSIPALANDMQDRYREKWTAYTQQVPYKLIPGIY